jgi:hypothetical protein
MIKRGNVCAEAERPESGNVVGLFPQFVTAGCEEFRRHGSIPEPWPQFSLALARPANCSGVSAWFLKMNFKSDWENEKDI